jgi:peptidyl-prolyl cis-trans isomerase SurA
MVLLISWQQVGFLKKEMRLCLKRLLFKKGLQEVFQEGNYYYVLMVNAIKPAGPKLFEECKGRVINDYQNHLESHWVSSLQKEFNVSIDTAVFQKVKSQIKP